MSNSDGASTSVPGSSISEHRLLEGDGTRSCPRNGAHRAHRDARASRGGKEERAVAAQHFSRSLLPTCSCTPLLQACLLERHRATEYVTLSLTLQTSTCLFGCSNQSVATRLLG